MRKLSRLFATKEASRGAAPRRRRKVAHLASAAESSAKLKAAAPVEMDVEVIDPFDSGMDDAGQELDSSVTMAHQERQDLQAQNLQDIPAESDGSSDLSSVANLSSEEAVAASLSGPNGHPFESGVYVSSRFTNADPNLVRQVTLVVYEWHNVEPGTLSWVFPSVQAALSAARAMRNAVKWAIIAGRRTAKVDVEIERASGLVLAEQAG